MRRLTYVLIVVLLLCLPLELLAETQQVIDNAHLFSESDEIRMIEIITRIEKKHQIDIVVLTTNAVPTDYSSEMWTIRNYADDYYDNHGYGMGEDRSGVLILLDMNNRVLYLSTGGVMIDYLTDSRIENILDYAYDYLSYSRYDEAIVAALNRVEHYMNRGREEGTFRYDEVTGQRIGGIYNALTPAEIGVAAMIGGGVALVIFLCVTGSYSLRGSTYSYDTGANTSVVLTQDEEMYLRQFSHRTPRNTGSHGPRSGGGRSGGSGVHRSSGGFSHGGGGRRF